MSIIYQRIHQPYYRFFSINLSVTIFVNNLLTYTSINISFCQLRQFARSGKGSTLLSFGHYLLLCELALLSVLTYPNRWVSSLQLKLQHLLHAILQLRKLHYKFNSYLLFALFVFCRSTGWSIFTNVYVCTLFILNYNRHQPFYMKTNDTITNVERT